MYDDALVAALREHAALYMDGDTARLVEMAAKRIEAKTAGDTSRMEWLEENLLTLTHYRASSTVLMDGIRCVVRGLNIHRDKGASTVTERGRSIREAIDKARGVR